ncbi:MAG: hypothetical protein QOJ07_1571 [Thermoleophilaceae bacterium]|nr:hypothetical protein [Thermoleophilaceae bacterium]
MRVAVVAEYYPRRRDPASGIWAHRQALAARAHGADVQVVVLERPLPPAAALRAAARGRPGALAAALKGAAAEPARDTIDGIPVEYARFVAPARRRAYASWHRWARLPLARALDRLHAEQPFDLVHAHYALPAGGAAAPWAAAHGLPLVVSVHGGDLLGAPLQSPAARRTVSGVLRGAAAVMCNSRATLRRAAALAGAGDNMEVVHLGAAAPDPLPPRHAEPTVATLAHVDPRKRHVDVLRAVAQVPGLRWVVIGDGPELGPLRALARELQVTDRVRFLGQLDPDAALIELARCHAMALPSEDEAFGVAYAEALACGVPAIGCRGEGGPEEIAALGPGMLLVAPRDPGALAQTLREVTGHPGDLPDAARRTAAEHLSWDRCGRATVAVYGRAMR